MLRTTLSLFTTIVTHFSKDAWAASANNPLWYNPMLNELLTFPDLQCWIFRGVKYLCHQYTEWGFKAFAQLREYFNLPSSYLFFYLQLQHALRTQFGSLSTPPQMAPLKKLLRNSETTKLISEYLV